MKVLRAPLFRWLAHGRRGYFALALSAMATLLVAGVSCSKAPEPERKVKMYQSPMHPWITSEKPGNCTICGMTLVPVYEGESGIEVDPGIVALNPRSVDVLAVTTVPVRRLDLTKSLRFSGILEDDENIHRIIAAFYDGRIDQIYVEHVGQHVEKGQPLAAIYSPELLYVVREYQNAMRSGDPAVARNSAQRLVQGRDLGGFVKELQQRIAQSIELPPGVTLKWSGQYESQLSAQRTLMLIVPVVLLIIFMLLAVVFRSVMEAAHVILAVPFALTGGALLQYLLGYNFSVAVWIGYIALFGTAIQTGVVMVVYLEEALARKRVEKGGGFQLQDLKAAVVEGAMLRLRPKVMTVSTVIASLLPIMWSTRTGTEVMKPLATPVIGGMLSSLLHVLIVTPVIFYWLRRRALRV